MEIALTADEISALAAAEGARPDPLLTISEWSDSYRTLSQRASAEPGAWRTDRTPYLREIMDCLSPSSPVETVVLMKGAQTRRRDRCSRSRRLSKWQSEIRSNASIH